MTLVVVPDLPEGTVPPNVTTPTYDPTVVLVPVPLDRLDAVLAARDGAVGQLPASEVDGPSAVGAEGWTDAMIRRLADELSYPLVLELFDTCSATPGTWIGKATIDMGKDPRQSRNELAAFTKLVYRLYGRHTRWPIQFRKVRGLYEYRLDADTAAVWREARGLDEDR